MTMLEQAITLIERMSEEDLQMFLSLFGRLYPAETAEQEADTIKMEERHATFERMKGVCRNIPDLDEKKEPAEHRNEKYEN